MNRLSLMFVCLLIPTGAMAQSQPDSANDAERGFVAPLSTIGSGNHGASNTETSPAKARSVRRAGKTIILSTGSPSNGSSNVSSTRMANAGS